MKELQTLFYVGSIALAIFLGMGRSEKYEKKLGSLPLCTYYKLEKPRCASYVPNAGDDPSVCDGTFNNFLKEFPFDTNHLHGKVEGGLYCYRCTKPADMLEHVASAPEGCDRLRW